MRRMVWWIVLVLAAGCSGSRRSAVSERQLAAHAARLAHEDPETRLLARLRLMQAGRPAVPFLLTALRGDDAAARYEAAAALSGMGPLPGAEAVPTLVDALRDDPDPTIRGHCVRVLAAIGPPAASALPAIRDALRDQHPYVCQSAVHALAAIEQAAAVPALIEALRSPNTCLDAALALGELGRAARPAVAELQELVQRGKPSARSAAAVALQRIQNPESVKLVR